jgi:YegS/Rv2252/BmrU family lipid kinase
MKSMMLINPNAGLLKECKTATEVKQQLVGLNLDPEIYIAKSSRGIKSFITQVKRSKPEVVLIAGGDGTISTIIKGLMDQPVTFGLIPTGSMNNIGQSIGLGDELQEAVEVINQGHTEKMDLGLINGQVFIESIGFGLVAEIMSRVGEQDSKKEVLKVVRHTLAEVVTTDTINVHMKADDRELDIETIWLTVTNTGRAAAALVDPSSNVHDRLLEVVYCEPIDNTELARYTMAFVRNSHIREEKFHRLRAKKIELTLPAKAQVHVDGELIEKKTRSISIIPAAIKVFTP